MVVGLMKRPLPQTVILEKENMARGEPEARARGEVWAKEKGGKEKVKAPKAKAKAKSKA